jgi:hypothetical protein
MDGNSAKWKQQTNRAEAEGYIVCRHLNGQALFIIIIILLQLDVHPVAVDLTLVSRPYTGQ